MADEENRSSLNNKLPLPFGRQKAGEVCRKMGIAQVTFYRRKQPYGGLMWSEVKKLRGLEEKDSRLRKVVPDLTLDRCCRR